MFRFYGSIGENAWVAWQPGWARKREFRLEDVTTNPISLNLMTRITSNYSNTRVVIHLSRTYQFVLIISVRFAVLADVSTKLHASHDRMCKQKDYESRKS